jgi:hypothetical protein
VQGAGARAEAEQLGDALLHGIGLGLGGRGGGRRRLPAVAARGDERLRHVLNVLRMAHVVQPASMPGPSLVGTGSGTLKP